jgi:hypothetical protein
MGLMPRRIVFVIAVAVASLTVSAMGASITLARSYVQVSPTDKEGGNVSATLGLIRSDASGDALAFTSSSAFAGAQAAPPLNWYLARRDASESWSTRALTPAQPVNPVEIANPARFLAFSSDFSMAVLRNPNPASPGASPGDPNLELENTTDGAIERITPPARDAPAPADFYFGTPWFAGSSTDFSRVVFESPRALTPEAPMASVEPEEANFGITNAYEWTVGNGLQLVGVLPDGEPASGGSSVGQGASGNTGSSTGNDTERAVSSDGSRVVFTTPAARGGVASGHLYQHIVGHPTLDVSASQRSTPDPDGAQPAEFWSASTDGVHVFFTSAEKLTDDATTDSTAGGDDLYRFNADTGTLEDISIDSTDPAGAQVQGVLGASDDGSTIYFAALGVLTSGAIQGSDNVYVWHEGTTELVATSGQETNWSTSATAKSSRVTADGRYLVFTSQARLTSLDNAGFTAVYRYDRETASMVCASCAPSDAPSTGDAGIVPEQIGAQDTNFENYQPRTISDDGQRVYFETTDALAPQDRNGVQDVYEYDGGTVSLISSGQSPAPSYFLDSSSSGEDVFFATGERLVPGDQDNLYDVYDATTRTVPAASPAESSPCAGDSCQGPLSSSPSLPSPTSGAVLGKGNLTSPGTKAVRSKPLTRAQQLAKALRVCRAQKDKKKRARCQARSRRKYGPIKRAKKTTRRSS